MIAFLLLCLTCYATIVAVTTSPKSQPTNGKPVTYKSRGAEAFTQYNLKAPDSNIQTSISVGKPISSYNTLSSISASSVKLLENAQKWHCS